MRQKYIHQSHNDVFTLPVACLPWIPIYPDSAVNIRFCLFRVWKSLDLGYNFECSYGSYGSFLLQSKYKQFYFILLVNTIYLLKHFFYRFLSTICVHFLKNCFWVSSDEYYTVWKRFCFFIGRFWIAQNSWVVMNTSGSYILSDIANRIQFTPDSSLDLGSFKHGISKIGYVRHNRAKSEFTANTARSNTE